MLLPDPDFINIFFSLLRSGLYGTPIPASHLPASINWDATIAFAKKQAVYGVIIDSIQFLPRHLHPSAAISAEMNKFALGLIQTNLIVDSTVARLVRFLNKYDIHGVLLKGQGVARYYRVPQMRQCGDIDFYVGKSQYNKAKELCREIILKDKKAGEENDHHFVFSMGGVSIELHRIASKVDSPFRKKRFQNWLVEQLEHSPIRRTLTIDNTDITLPSYDFDAMFIFYHAWRHFISGGIGLRQLSDWAMIIHSHAADIDTDSLIENIRRFGLTTGWKLFACIAVDYLGVAEDKMPLFDPSYRKKSKKIMRDIIDGGNFGYYAKEYERTPIRAYGLWQGLGKVRNITGYYISRFPLIPVESTFHYFHHLFFGTIALTKRTLHRHKN